MVSNPSPTFEVTSASVSVQPEMPVAWQAPATPVRGKEIARLMVPVQALHKSAEQFAGTPTPPPVQVQFHGPVPVTALGVPVSHRLTSGAFGTVVPLLGPQ